MAEQGAEQGLKQATNWAIEEVDRLALCWVDVSTEKGGVGANRRNDSFWAAITEKYLNNLPPPPVPRDRKGNQCLPRTQNGMEQKWKRTRTLIGKYMNCHMLALSIPVSGENEKMFLERVMQAYVLQDKGHNRFEFLSTYDLIKENEKFRLDISSLVKGMEQQTGAARRCVAELLEREIGSAPTVASTGKPEGVKKARRTMAEQKEKAKEIAIEEARLEAVVEELTHRRKNQTAAVAQGIIRDRVLQNQTDAAIFAVDMTDMDAMSVEFYTLRRKAALEHAREWEVEKEQARNSARDAMLAAEAALAAETDRIRTANREERTEEERRESEEGEGDDEDDFDNFQDHEGLHGSDETFYDQNPTE